jgi:hypothetical protein
MVSQGSGCRETDAADAGRPRIGTGGREEAEPAGAMTTRQVLDGREPVRLVFEADDGTMIPQPQQTAGPPASARRDAGRGEGLEHIGELMQDVAAVHCIGRLAQVLVEQQPRRGCVKTACTPEQSHSLETDFELSSFRRSSGGTDGRSDS